MDFMAGRGGFKELSALVFSGAFEIRGVWAPWVPFKPRLSEASAFCGCSSAREDPLFEALGMYPTVYPFYWTTCAKMGIMDARFEA